MTDEDSMECLETMISVVRTFGSDLPTACQTTCQEAWSCLDLFISKYGLEYEASDRVTRLIRHGLTFFGSAALPVASAVISRMTSSFETTGNPGYVWIIGKVLCEFGNEEDPNLRGAFKESYDRVSAKVLSLLQEKSPAAIPDGKQDVLENKPFIDGHSRQFSKTTCTCLYIPWIMHRMCSSIHPSHSPSGSMQQ